MFNKIIIFVLCIFIGNGIINGETKTYTIISDKENIKRINSSGPRIGFTYLPQKAVDNLQKVEPLLGTKNEKMWPVLSQFGWQFGTMLTVEKEAPTFLFTLVPLIGGFEQNIIIITVSGLAGIRLKGNIEIGIGPTISGFGSSISFVIGKSFQYGKHMEKMNIPVHIVFMPSKNGVSISLLTGFNWEM